MENEKMYTEWRQYSKADQRNTNQPTKPNKGFANKSVVNLPLDWELSAERHKLQGRIQSPEREHPTLEPMLCGSSPRRWLLWATRQGLWQLRCWIYCHLLSEAAVCALCPQRSNWNLQQVSFRPLTPCVRDRKGGLKRGKKKGGMILSRDRRGCAGFPLCFSVTQLFNSCLHLNTKRETKWSQSAGPVLCYFVKGAPCTPIAFWKNIHIWTPTG